MGGAHAALEMPEHDAQEGDAVAVLGVHVGLDLEDEAGKILVCRGETRPASLWYGCGGGARSTKASRNRRTPKLVSALPKKTGRLFAGQHARVVECDAQAVQQFDLGAVRPPGAAQDAGSIGAVSRSGDEGLRRHALVVLGALVQVHARARRSYTPLNCGPSPSGQLIGTGCMPSTVFDFVQQLQRVAGRAVHLVDEGEDRDAALAADFKQPAGLRLDPFGGVQHHHGAVHGGQGAVGVFGEILVARACRAS